MIRIPRKSIPGLAATLVLAALAPATPVAAQTSISTAGAIESKSGGFKFPDGSVQTSAAVPVGTCPTFDPSDEMIRVGGICIDKYEASIWDAQVGGNQLVGTIPCNRNGQDCVGVIFARSVAGVEPRGAITWFQAQQALANSGKRLPTNAEWQMAVAGTPDDTKCNVSTFSVSNTGVFGSCASDWGVFDMVGNLWEWVADWVPPSTACPGWGSFSDDFMCFAGAGTTRYPSALVRGGSFVFEEEAGPFAIDAFIHDPVNRYGGVGFRGAR